METKRARRGAEMPTIIRKKRNVSLCRFGAGNELITIFPHSRLTDDRDRSSTLRTLVLDRIPSKIDWANLYETAFESLSKLGTSPSQSSLLATSIKLRTQVMELSVAWALDPAKELPFDARWLANMRRLLLCWRAMEISVLERSSFCLRTVLMKFANDACQMEWGGLRPQLVGFDQGEALLLQGKHEEAAAVFRTLIVGHSGRVRRFYELLSDICDSMTIFSSDDTGEAEFARFQGEVGQLEGILSGSKQYSREQRLVRMLSGDVKTLVSYCQSEDAAKWGGRSWLRLLALVLYFHEPLAPKHVLASLSDKCATAVPLNAPSLSIARNAGFEEEENETNITILAGLKAECLKAIQLLLNIDAFSEFVMAELFAKSGALETAFPILPQQINVRQAALLNFVLSLAVGPGRVPSREFWTRKSEEYALARAKMGLSYLRLFPGSRPVPPLEAAVEGSHRKLYHVVEAIVDRLGLGETDVQTARQLIAYIREVLPQDQSIARRLVESQLETNLVRLRYSRACLWNDILQSLNNSSSDVSRSLPASRLLDYAVQLLLERESSSGHQEVESTESGPVLSRHSQAAMDIFRARSILVTSNDVSQAIQMVATSLELVSLDSKRRILASLLLEEDEPKWNVNLSSTTCLQLLRLLDVIDIVTPRLLSERTPSSSSFSHVKSQTLRGFLGILFAQAIHKEHSHQEPPFRGTKNSD